MRLKYSSLSLALFALVFFGAAQSWSLDCNVTKEGIITVSPQELQFYVQQEQTNDPTPVTVYVNGFGYAEDDGCASSTSFQETVDFCWMAAKSAPWIKLTSGGQDIGAMAYYLSAHDRNSFQVGVDITNLPLYEGSATTMYNGMYYDANVTVYSTLVQGGVHQTYTIPVRVYVNPLRENAGEMTVATPDWINLTLNVPISENITGALYLLAEHPRRLPGQVYAYRWHTKSAPELYLFSQWGMPVQGAEQLYYAEDIQNTPIAIPFSQGPDEYVIPYGATTEKIKSYIPVPFLPGLRLIGLEGDIIVRALVGNPNNLQDWQSWRELFYYVIHIIPATGNWIVTENLNGQSFTYIDSDTAATYPMMINEDKGVLSGIWKVPAGQTTLYIDYANSTDSVCTSLTVQGHRLSTNNCVMEGGYEVWFTEPSVFGMIDYSYHIRNLHITGNDYGKLSGTWQWRFSGETDWSFPESFSAVKQSVVIPLDPVCNCYQVNGFVNGYGVPFIVDTGASTVLLDSNDAWYMGIDLTDPVQCPFTGTGVVAGGGTIPITICYADIEIEGRLLRKGVEVAFADNPGPALLGMTFLDQFHVSTSAADGTMIIAP